MATGTGNLPASNDSTSPFQILTSEHMNNIKANIDALANGSGIGDEAITSGKLAGAITADKLDWVTMKSYNNYAVTAEQTKSLPGGYTAVWYENHTATLEDMALGIYEISFRTPYYTLSTGVEFGLLIESPTKTGPHLSPSSTLRVGSTNSILGGLYVSCIIEHPGGDMTIRGGAQASGPATAMLRGGLLMATFLHGKAVSP